MQTYVMIMAIAGVVLAGAVVLLVFRLWSTLGELELFIRETRQETTPILRKTDDALTRIDRMSEIIENRVEDADHEVDTVLKNLTVVSEDIRSLSDQWRTKLQPNGRWTGWVSTIVASGYQAFQKYREKKQSQEGGTTHE